MTSWTTGPDELVEGPARAQRGFAQSRTHRSSTSSRNGLRGTRSGRRRIGVLRRRTYTTHTVLLREGWYPRIHRSAPCFSFFFFLSLVDLPSRALCSGCEPLLASTEEYCALPRKRHAPLRRTSRGSRCEGRKRPHTFAVSEVPESFSVEYLRSFRSAALDSLAEQNRELLRPRKKLHMIFIVYTENQNPLIVRIFNTSGTFSRCRSPCRALGPCLRTATSAPTLRPSSRIDSWLAAGRQSFATACCRESRASSRPCRRRGERCGGRSPGRRAPREGSLRWPTGWE